MWTTSLVTSKCLHLIRLIWHNYLTLTYRKLNFFQNFFTWLLASNYRVKSQLEAWKSFDLTVSTYFFGCVIKFTYPLISLLFRAKIRLFAEKVNYVSSDLMLTDGSQGLITFWARARNVSRGRPCVRLFCPYQPKWTFRSLAPNPIISTLDASRINQTWPSRDEHALQPDIIDCCFLSQYNLQSKHNWWINFDLFQFRGYLIKNFDLQHTGPWRQRAVAPCHWCTP